MNLEESVVCFGGEAHATDNSFEANFSMTPNDGIVLVYNCAVD
jgi:hypothetical protein